MEKRSQHFDYLVFNDSSGLDDSDEWLLKAAREVTDHAYAPYSHFQVGAVIKLSNGEIVTGSNQENVSFPIGLCAERVALAAAAAIYPHIEIDSIAISYHHLTGDSSHPVSPCGMCRQALSEYEMKQQHPIRVILGGMSGNVYVINHANDLLPLSFTINK